MTAHQLAALAALARYSHDLTHLPNGMPAHDGRTTVAGQQLPLRSCLDPQASLSLEGYARAAGVDEPSVVAPRAIVVVNVESRAGRVPTPRVASPEGATVPEW